MAIITAGGPGAWNSVVNNAPWPGGAIPAITDTIITGAFAITVPNGYNAIIGTSPANDAGTTAIAVSALGSITIQAGGRLTFRGPVRIAQTGTITVQAGGIYEHDSSLAAVPATANYTTRIGSAAAGTPTYFNITGAAGNRAICRIAAGSGPSGGFTGGNLIGANCGLVKATYGTLTDWGTTTAASYCVNPYPSTAGSETYFSHCLMDRCGRMIAQDLRNNCNYYYEFSSYRSPVVTGAATFLMDNAGNGASISPTGGDRRVESCFVEGIVCDWNSSVGNFSSGFKYKGGNVFAGTTTAAPMLMPGGTICAEWDNNMLFNRVAASANPSNAIHGTITRTMFLRTGGLTNPHFIDSIKRTVLYDGWYAENRENTLSSGGGDLFQSDCTGGTNYTIGIKHGVAVPEPSGGPAFDIYNHSAATATPNGPTVTGEHNTWIAQTTGAQVAGFGGENNSSVAGMFPSLQSNICWRSALGTIYVFKYESTKTPANGSVTTADYNARYNSNGAENGYYKSNTVPLIYTNPIGTHDIVNQNPNFRSTTKRFLDWAQSVDPTVTSWDDALNRFSLMNDDSGSIPGFTVLASYTWCRQWWAPQNILYRNAGHDGADVGALSFYTNARNKFAYFNRRRRYI